MMIAKGFHKKNRSGFTLIELLVVIAIIAILMSLTAAGVMRFLHLQKQVACQNDIYNLSVSLESFKGVHGVYPPSRIFLGNSAGSMDSANKGLLTPIFTGLRGNWSVDWSGGTYGWGNNPVELQGDQCLVFFLGGIPSTSPNAATGFADPRSSNPASPNGRTSRYGFEFKSSRLYKRGSNAFFSYKDPYEKQPFAYFSSYGGDNYQSGDCSGLGVAPYKLSNGQYMKANSFQIISAGRNGSFGSGGTWNPSNPNLGNAGQDDQSNFVSGLMNAGE